MVALAISVWADSITLFPQARQLPELPITTEDTGVLQIPSDDQCPIVNHSGASLQQESNAATILCRNSISMDTLGLMSILQ